jgi:mRNA interferase MazF
MINNKKEYDEWNNIKKETSVLKINIKIREGEIRWCRLGLNIGNETRGKGLYFERPVLILKKFSSEVFLGIPVTSKTKSGTWFYSLKTHNRTLILNQARILDIKRLRDKIYELSEVQVKEIKEAFCRLIKS